MRQIIEPVQADPAPPSARSSEDLEARLEARTFVAALVATVALFAKPLLWGAFILALLALMLAEPLG